MKELLGSMLLGWLLACTGAGHSGGCLVRSRPDRAALWVACDRSRNQVLWLDRDLIVCEVWRVPSPVALACSAGQFWVASALEGKVNGPHRLLCLSWDGHLLGSWDTGPISDLAVLGDQKAVVVLAGAGSAGAVLWSCDALGHWSGPQPVPGARSLRAYGAGVWVLGMPGRVAWLAGKGPGAPQFFDLPESLQSQSGAQVHGGGLWCRGPTKSSPWRLLNPETGIWSGAHDRPWLPDALKKLWPTKVRERKAPALVAWLEAHEITRGPDGSWLLRGPEYLWQLDRPGTPRRGQGGFSYLTGAAWVR